jgi:hypothetical protein
MARTATTAAATTAATTTTATLTAGVDLEFELDRRWCCVCVCA